MNAKDLQREIHERLSLAQRRQLMADWYQANDDWEARRSADSSYDAPPPNQREFTLDWIRRNA